jgi:hypothetical protein
MKESNENTLVKRFPKIFKDYRTDPRQSPMAFGFECGDGWFQLIYDLCSDIESICKESGIEVTAVQVKEKFGGLRFYFHNTIKETFLSGIHFKIRTWMFDHKYGIKYWKIIDLKRYLWKTPEEKIEDLVSNAEDKSFKICEQCGKPGKRLGKFWIYTMCEKCAEEKGVKYDQESSDEDSEENDQDLA